MKWSGKKCSVWLAMAGAAMYWSVMDRSVMDRMVMAESERTGMEWTERAYKICKTQ